MFLGAVCRPAAAVVDVGLHERAEEVVCGGSVRAIRAILDDGVSRHDEAVGGTLEVEHLALGLYERLAIAGQLEPVHSAHVRAVLLHCK